MTRQIGWAFATLLTFGFSPPETPHSRPQAEQSNPPQQKQQPSADRREDKGQPGHPRFPWWKDEKLRAAVGFSVEQGNEIERIVMPTLEQMRPLRREVEQLDKEIEKMVVDSADLMVFKQQVEKVEARRAELNKMRTVMLYRIRRVFTPEQNARFRAAYERWEEARKKQDGDRRK